MGLYDRYLALRIRAADASPPEHVALVITERDLLEPGAYDTLSEFLEWAFAYGAEGVAVYVSVLDPEAVAPLRRGIESVDAPRAMAVHGSNEPAVDERGAVSDGGGAGTRETTDESAEPSGAAPSKATEAETPEVTESVQSEPGGDTTSERAGSPTSGPAGLPTSEQDGSPMSERAGDTTAEPAGAPASEAPIQVSVGLGGKHEFTEAVRSLAEEAAAGELDPAEIDEDDVESELVFSAEPDLVIKTGAERLSDFMIWQSVYSELYFTDVNWRNFRKRDYLRAIREYLDRSRRFGR